MGCCNSKTDRLAPKRKWEQYKEVWERLREAPDNLDPDFITRQWEEKQGLELEPALASGAVALLDSHWLVDFSYTDQVLPCRQQLPKEAFVPLEEIKKRAFCCELDFSSEEEMIDIVNIQKYKKAIPAGCLPIIVMSYTWLHPDHPDPKGTTLRKLSCWLQNQQSVEKFEDEDIQTDLEREPWLRWAIFWDWASLYQHPDPRNGLKRTKSEEALFQEGLKSLAMLFSHPKTKCWKVTEFPRGYPHGYELPPEANRAQYHERGWPTVESSLVCLVKASYMTKDLCHDAVAETGPSKTRPAPIHPDSLAFMLKKVSFTNAKADRPLVNHLYKDEFIRRFAETTRLHYTGLEWGDEQVIRLSDIIREGYTPKLREINLDYNCFGDEGCKALVKALTDSSDPDEQGQHAQVEDLNLGCNWRIGVQGIRALSQIIVHGLKKINLCSCGLGDPECKALAEALRQHPRNLESIDLSYNNEIGPKGCLALAKALSRGQNEKSGHNLQEINLAWNLGIGDEGISALADVLVTIPIVNLSNMNFGVSGCRALATAADAKESWILLRDLNLEGNSDVALDEGGDGGDGGDGGIGDQGLEVLSRMIIKHLEVINLSQCGIEGSAYRALGDAAKKYSGPSSPLREIDLQSDNFDSSFADDSAPHFCQLVANCPQLVSLKLSGGSRGLWESVRASAANADFAMPELFDGDYDNEE